MSGGQISTAACRGRGKLVCGFHKRGGEEGKEIKNQTEKENGNLGVLQTAYGSRYLTVVSIRHLEAIETASPSVFFVLLAACLID